MKLKVALPSGKNSALVRMSLYLVRFWRVSVDAAVSAQDDHEDPEDRQLACLPHSEPSHGLEDVAVHHVSLSANTSVKMNKF